jgi:hypothetical protein
MLVAGEKSGALAVFAVDPSTGTATPFGPALPVDASALQVSQLFSSADRARAIVVLTRKPATPGWTNLPSPILAGDGTQWVTLFSGIDGASVVSAAEDLSLAVLYHECNPVPAGPGPTGNLVSVVASDGTHLFDEGSCSPPVRVGTGVKVAPHGSFFVYRNANGDTVVRDRAGVEHIAARDPNLLLPATVFDTSFVTFRPNGPEWFDFSGASIVILGLPASYSIDGTHAVSDTGVWALDGKTARQTLSAQSGQLSPPNMRGVLTDSLVTLFDEQGNGATRARALDAAGSTVATYGPPPAPSDASRVATIANFAQFGADGGPAWLIVDVLDSTAAPQQGYNPSYRRYEDLWVLRDASGTLAPRVVRLREAPDGDATATLTLRTYVPSASGAHALYVENAELHSVDTATGTDTKLAVDWTVSDRSIAVAPPN